MEARRASESSDRAMPPPPRARPLLKRLAIAVYLLVLMLTTGAVVMSYGRPRVISYLPFDLYALKLDRGDLQLMHGESFLLNADATGSVRIAWADESTRGGLASQPAAPPIDLRSIRIIVSNWPPLRQEGMITVGPMLTTKMIYYGRRVTVRSMSAWLLLSLLALPLVAMASRAVRSSRFRQGHCPTCGYDLRASPERCPECGTEAIPNAANPNAE